MKSLIFSLGAILMLNMSFAQAPAESDPKAKAILDDLSKTTKSYKSITAEYSFITINKDKKQTDKQDGKIQVKGQKFKLEIPNNTIVCDGKTIWNFNKEANEVTIKDFSPSDDDLMDPTKIFTIYEKGFKYVYEKEEKAENGATLTVINLYPTVKPEKKKFHTVKLYVDKVKKQIKRIKLMMKDGGTQQFEIKKFTPNLELADASFTFDTAKFKKDQIIDEREGK